ncbi:MAG: glycosyltransferase family 39 protein, partial [Ignavibacteriales bacterium]|nr:glycosyltransferase family 39 protein [Ignavibacteriales bacterium]
MKLLSFSKLNSLSDETKERLYVSLIAVIGLLRFVNLGFLDLQAWDEALYAVRAEGILRFGHWIDQTPFAIDGLYSSLHPPFHVWLTAVSFALFGETEFAARFFSAVAAGLTLPIIFHIGKHIANRHTGFLAALLFGLNPFVTFFARQGQFDSTLVFFLSLAMLWLIKAHDNSSLKYGLLAGLAIGGALMTKLYVGMGIPLTYIAWIFLAKPTNKSVHWKIFGAMLLGMILTASPWHIYMTIIHGNGNPLFFITSSALFERTLSGVEGNVKPLEVFYFFNQLFVLFPIGVMWFGCGVYKTLRNRESNWLLLGIWFFVFFIVFSVMRTKLAVYL